MDKPKHYKKIEEQPQTVSEPMAVYNSTIRSAEEYLEAIPEETIRTLVDLSIEDYKLGRCTSHPELDAWIKGRMGWK